MTCDYNEQKDEGWDWKRFGQILLMELLVCVFTAGLGMLRDHYTNRND